MNAKPDLSVGTVHFSTHTTRSTLARWALVGDARRIANGVYVVGATAQERDVVRAHLFQIVAHFWPGGVLCGRSALSGGQPTNRELFISCERGRSTTLAIGDLRVIPIRGPGALDGDLPLPHGLFLSGSARSLVENMQVAGRPAKYRAGALAIEAQIASIVSSDGPPRIRRILTNLDQIAGAFDPAAVEAIRQRLVATLGSYSRDDFAPLTPAFASSITGAPVDLARLDLFRGLKETLEGQAPRSALVLGPSDRFAWEPFFESYFSNFIEGTEFTVDEARQIAVDGLIPAGRPADAHDVAATFLLASEDSGRGQGLADAESFTQQLQALHANLMAARPEKRPGQFKERPNFAGGYEFVRPDLLLGTLQHGFALLCELSDPFARAVAMMALVTECHPFDDGNGRLARLMANAQLSQAGLVRLVIPTVLRGDYLAALAGFSRRLGSGESLIAVLEFAQRWTARVDWSTFEGAKAILEATNAFFDSSVAEAAGVRLRLPGS